MTRKLTLLMMALVTLTTFYALAGNNPHIKELDLSIDGVADDKEYFEVDPNTPSPTPNTTPTANQPKGPGAFIASNAWKKITLKATGVDPMKTRLNLCSDKIEIWTATNGGTQVICPKLYDPASSMPTELWVKGVKVSDYGPGKDASGNWTNCGPEHITLEAINNGNDLPTTPGTYYDNVAFTVLTVELKVTHPQNPGPTRSEAKYKTPTPKIGSADNLFSTWDNEQLRVDVKIEPTSFASSLPAGFIIWAAAGFSVPVNATGYTFTWSAFGTKTVSLSFPFLSAMKEVQADVPDVGRISEGEAAGWIRAPAAALIARYANEAIQHVQGRGGANRDAIRHSYWNALGASSIHMHVSEMSLVATAHEWNNKMGIDTTRGGGIINVRPQQAFNSTMDLHNNEIGRSVVRRTIFGNPDKTALQNELDRLYSAGRMWVWDGGASTTEGQCEGILLKSNYDKIY